MLKKKESERLEREAAETERRYEEHKRRIEREREEAAARMRAEQQARRQREIEERRAKVADIYHKYMTSEEYTSFGKDEAEITFDPADIIKDLNKVKSENPGKFKLKGGLKRLNNMQETLKDIERIVDTLNAMITDNNWEVFSHSSTENTDKMEDGDTKTFIISYRNLEDNFAKLRELINGKQDNVEELEIDDIIAFFKSIKQITDEINKKCKSGIAKCKKKHKEHTSHKADLIRSGKSVDDDVDRNIANVKSAYNILNNILKKVNEFCKGLRRVFGYVCRPDNYTNALVLPFKLDRYSDDGTYSFGILIDMEEADFEDVIKGLINHQRGKAGIDRKGIITELSYEISPTQSGFHLRMAEGSNGRGSAGFSDMPPFVNHRRKEILDRIRERKRIVEKIENDYPEIKDYFLKIFGIVEDFYNVPAEEWLKVKSINERQEGKKLSDLSYFIASNRYKVAGKTLERYFQKKITRHIWMKRRNQTSQVDNFIQTIQSTMGTLESAMRRDASDEFGKFKSRFERAVNEYQNEHDEDDLIAVHNAIEKYVYGSYSRFDNEAWSKVESWLENIGYKSINAKPGDSINPIRTYFARPIPAATSDKSQDMTIKQVRLQPRVLKIKIDGDTQTHKLAGICSYYKYKA